MTLAVPTNNDSPFLIFFACQKGGYNLKFYNPVTSFLYNLNYMPANKNNQNFLTWALVDYDDNKMTELSEIRLNDDNYKCGYQLTNWGRTLDLSKLNDMYWQTDAGPFDYYLRDKTERAVMISPRVKRLAFKVIKDDTFVHIAS